MEPSRTQGTQRDRQREGAVGSAREDRLRPCQLLKLLKPLKRQPTHGRDFYSDITKLCIREKKIRKDSKDSDHALRQQCPLRLQLYLMFTQTDLKGPV